MSTIPHIYPKRILAGRYIKSPGYLQKSGISFTISVNRSHTTQQTKTVVQKPGERVR